MQWFLIFCNRKRTKGRKPRKRGQELGISVPLPVTKSLVMHNWDILLFGSIRLVYCMSHCIDLYLIFFISC